MMILHCGSLCLGAPSCVCTIVLFLILSPSPSFLLQLWDLNGFCLKSFSLDHTPSSPMGTSSHGPSRSTSDVLRYGSNDADFKVSSYVFSGDVKMVAAAVNGRDKEDYTAKVSHMVVT